MVLVALYVLENCELLIAPISTFPAPPFLDPAHSAIVPAITDLPSPHDIHNQEKMDQ